MAPAIEVKVHDFGEDEFRELMGLLAGLLPDMDEEDRMQLAVHHAANNSVEISGQRRRDPIEHTFHEFCREQYDNPGWCRCRHHGREKLEVFLPLNPFDHIGPVQVARKACASCARAWQEEPCPCSLPECRKRRIARARRN